MVDRVDKVDRVDRVDMVDKVDKVGKVDKGRKFLAVPIANCQLVTHNWSLLTPPSSPSPISVPINSMH